MHIQQFLAISLALLTALIAIGGNTWDTARRRPTAVGTLAIFLAIATFGVGIWGLKIQREMEEQIQAAAINELVESLYAVKMELIRYQVALGESQRRDTKKLSEYCDQISDTVIRHRDIFYPKLSVTLKYLRSTCSQSLKADMTWQEAEDMAMKIKNAKNDVCLHFFGQGYFCKE